MAKAKKTEYTPTYTIGQLAEAAEPVFATHPVVVKAALEHGGKSEYTMDEAKIIINTFTHREV